MIRRCAIAAALVAALSACGGKSRGPDVPVSEPKAYEQSKAAVNLLDSKLKGKIASEVQRAEPTPDGRTLVTVNLRNRTKKDLHVQYRTVFKDSQGISTGDQSAWSNLYFSPQQVQTVRTESKKPGSQLTTVEVRLPPKP